MKIPFIGLISIAIAGNASLLFFLDAWFLNTPLPGINYGFIILFAILTFIIHHYLLAVNKKSPRQFVTFFMGSITLKLFFTVGILFVYLYMNQDQSKPVALSFMFTYLLFTVIEIVSLFKLLKTN